MARIRTLKPEILEDAVTAGLSDAAFRLFVSSIVLADDYGNLQGDERWLRQRIWWAHEKSPRFSEILRELRRASLVTLYTVREQVYLHINGWSKHQRIDNAGKRHIPDHSDTEAVVITDDLNQQEIARGDSRRNSASRGDSRLDLDQEKDKEEEGEVIESAESRLWALQEKLRAEVIEGSRPLLASKKRLARITVILQSASEADAVAVLESIAANVKVDPEQAQWFNGDTNWRPDNFDRALGRVNSIRRPLNQDIPGRDWRESRKL